MEVACIVIGNNAFACRSVALQLGASTPPSLSHSFAWFGLSRNSNSQHSCYHVAGHPQKHQGVGRAYAKQLKLVSK
jgi:hypothetical protein